MSPGPLAGRTFIVTGARRGTGRAVVETLLRLGATVGAATRVADGSLDGLAALHGDRIAPLLFDVRNESEVAHAAGRYGAQVGRLDGLALCAGIGGPPSLLLRASVDRCREIIDTNLVGNMIVVKHCLRHLLRSDRPAIVAVGSTSATDPDPGVTAYAASKGGVESFCRAVAAEYASRGLACHCLHLGPVDTDMFREMSPAAKGEALRRAGLASPMEVAKAAEAVLRCLCAHDLTEAIWNPGPSDRLAEGEASS